MVSEISEEYQKIYLDNLETEAGKKVVEAAEATNTALEAAERASEAINELYSMDVTDKSPAIVCGVTGKAISIADSAEMPIKGLRLFGKSTQDGTPTPEAPVEIVSVESPAVTVAGKNLAYSKGNKDVEYEGLHIVITKGLSEVFLHGTTAKPFGYAMMEGAYLVPGVYTMSVYGLNTVSPKYDQAYLLDLETRETICTEVKSNVPVAFTVTHAGSYRIDFLFAEGTTYDNATIRVQIEARSEATEYEPYKAPQTAELTHTLPGIPVTSGGNYTDENGHQWVCDEVDLERGVYVKRIGVIDSYNAEEITTKFMSTTGQLSTGARILYVEHEVVETPLTETEIAAYKALHTNYPNTVVISEADMEVKYAADTKLYIDKKIKELVTALVNN